MALLKKGSQTELIRNNNECLKLLLDSFVTVSESHANETKKLEDETKKLENETKKLENETKKLENELELLNTSFSRITESKSAGIFRRTVSLEKSVFLQQDEVFCFLLDELWKIFFIFSDDRSFRESQDECSLYAIGGCDIDELASVSRYDPMERKWTATTPMPLESSLFGCAMMDHKIYVCAGWKPTYYQNTLMEFDTKTQTWAELTRMKHSRQNCAAAVLNGQLYVAGGWIGTESLAVVERYCFRTHKWEDVSPMTTKRSGLELVALDGFLYAIGGSEGGFKLNDKLNTIERYSPRTDRWTQMANMNYEYAKFGSAVLNGHIYIVGEDKCEVYHPTDNRWTQMAAPSNLGKGRRLAVYKKQLFAMGGKKLSTSPFREGVKSVEVFDFRTRTWKPEVDMNVARCFHGVAVA